ncbi:hypothetical protein GCM10027347_61330 [Larkinella harenae]
MSSHKLKVYLKEHRGSEMIDGHYFYGAYTRWTFLEATTEQMKLRPQSEEGAYRQFSGCIPADGQTWKLSELSACVLESDVEMPEGYRIHKRGLWQIPVYPAAKTPELLTAEQVSEQFPLVSIWGGALIGTVEYVLKNGRLQRKHQNMAKSYLEDKAPEVEEDELEAVEA